MSIGLSNETFEKTVSEGHTLPLGTSPVLNRTELLQIFPDWIMEYNALYIQAVWQVKLVLICTDITIDDPWQVNIIFMTYHCSLEALLLCTICRCCMICIFWASNKSSFLLRLSGLACPLICTGLVASVKQELKQTTDMHH